MLDCNCKLDSGQGECGTLRHWSVSQMEGGLFVGSERD